ncbi:hypothetical protein C0J45_20442 [Silurus meridionalis]|nr:hypothetical protein C0J45_20442 [Silurus meridionalis]
MMLIWKSFLRPSSPSSSTLPPRLVLASGSSERPVCTASAVSPAARAAASTLPSLPVYVGLFACLLLLVLALVFATLYRMKHTVAPMPCYSTRAGTEAEADAETETEAETTEQETEETRAETSSTSDGVV